jgi:hypothetical protein
VASHFSTIGLRVGSEQEMFDLANRVGPGAEPTRAPGGAYFRWADPSGAELWLQVNDDNELLGMNPHFAGVSAVRVRLTARVETGSPSPLDGMFHGWADPADGGDEDGAYPFLFDAPDARLHDGLALPAVVSVQVAAFAHEVEAFDSPEAHATSQGDGPKFASQSFIPSGLFNPQGADAAPPRAHAMITGHVLDAERRTNRLTGEPFYWCLADSYGGVYDVVIDPELLPDLPKVGGVVSGSFWLTGRILGG